MSNVEVKPGDRHGCERLEGKFPRLFGEALDNLVYYHSHAASNSQLLKAEELCPLFEIDLAWAHSTFMDSVPSGFPFIGHPEEFYTKMGNPFPKENVSLEEFQQFMMNNPSIKVLIDIKDDSNYMSSKSLEDLVFAIGTSRCIVHAFIENWTVLPAGAVPEPHIYREDVNLAHLDKQLSLLGVPLIANCRAFSNKNIENNNIIDKMITDAQTCKSVISLGIYLPTGTPAPDARYLKAINQAGFYAWVNGNAKSFEEVLEWISPGDCRDGWSVDDGCTDCSDDLSYCSDSNSLYEYSEWKDLKIITMSDSMEKCTGFKEEDLEARRVDEKRRIREETAEAVQ